MGVNITTIVYLRVLIIEIGSTIVLMVVEAQGYDGLKTIVRYMVGPVTICHNNLTPKALKVKVKFDTTYPFFLAMFGAI